MEAESGSGATTIRLLFARYRPNIRGMEGLLMMPGPVYKRFFKTAAITFLAVSAFAQAPPKYDTATEGKVKGTVEEVKIVPPTGGKPLAYLVLKSGADAVQVFLCPKKFLDDMGVAFKADDEIEVTGSKIKQDGADLTLAREVVLKGGDTLTLRFKDGKPAW
jgi:hypothetical protein